ncbi:hypothetical protein B0H10DRAFT_2068714 [Mycena sp. CBHHK59/15]|nr:hypothetical protein B0H10DRAFT_2068714 [Mycena sp. CBHHK59/15]
MPKASKSTVKVTRRAKKVAAKPAELEAHLRCQPLYNPSLTEIWATGTAVHDTGVAPHNPDIPPLTKDHYVFIQGPSTLRAPDERKYKDNPEGYVRDHALYADSLYKAQILEIRKVKDGKVLVQVVWLLSPKEAREELRPANVEDSVTLKKLTAPWELVGTNVRAIVRLTAILGKASVRPYNEQDRFAEMQTHVQWLKRWQLNFDYVKETVTLHRIFEFRDTLNCPCQEGYNPWTNKQYYCPNQVCHMWYHVKCCQDYGEPITKHKINPEDNDIRHILQIPLSRGYGQKADDEDDDDDEDNEVSDDSEFRDKHWLVVGWWRLWRYCQILEEEGKEELPSNWQEMVLEEDRRPVSSGWPRDDEEKRKEFAETLLNFLLQEDEWEVHLCPLGHKMQYSLPE